MNLRHANIYLGDYLNVRLKCDADRAYLIAMDSYVMYSDQYYRFAKDNFPWRGHVVRNHSM